MPDYTTGILLICLGNLCAATGLTLMKSSTVHEGEKPFFLRWRWLAGFSFLGVLTTVVDVYVLGFLPLSVVAPFAGLTIVFTLAIASTGLLNEPEPLRHTDVIGIGFIIVGEVVVSVFGPHSSHGLTSAEIMADAQKPVFAAFAAASMATVLTWVALGMLPAARERCLRAAAEAGGAASLLATALSAYSAAVCGALSQLFVKVVAVTANAAGGDFTGAGSPWRQLPPYLALVGLVVTAPLQLYLLDTALTGSAVSYAVPVYQALLILLTTVLGGVFFGEFDTMSPTGLLIFGAGVATAATGLAVLSAAGADDDGADDDDAKAADAAPTTPGLPEISRRRSHPGSHDGRPPSRSQSVHPHRRHSVVRETVVIGSAALGMQMLAEKRTSPETRSRAATVGSAPARLYHRYDEGPGAPDARIRSMTMV